MRLFVALTPPGGVRADLVAARDAALESAPAEVLRAVPEEQLHCTLAFLGDVPEPDRIVEVLAGAVRGVAPLSLRLTGAAGRFGGRVLWAGLDSSPALGALAGSVRHALGVDGEAVPFRAHVTLARARGRDGAGAGLRAVVAAYRGPRVSWTATAVLVVRSRLGGIGARHEVLAKVPLQVIGRPGMS